LKKQTSKEMGNNPKNNNNKKESIHFRGVGEITPSKI
jgi:hypothetical protein